MKKNFALALALTIALGSTAPVFAYSRDGGQERGFSPIERVINLIKKLLKPSSEDGISEPHP